MDIIPKYRTELMGIATLFILLFHYGAPIPMIENIVPLGYCGVDIFLFLSGFGLYFSLDKSESKAGFNHQTINAFYFRRFVRILPVYFIVVLCALALRGELSITNLLLYPTGLGYYLCITPLSRYMDIGYYDWYVPTILCFYLIFPAIYKSINRFPLQSFVATLAISILIVIGYNVFEDSYFHLHVIGVSRLAIFALGAILGYYTKRGVDLDRYAIPLVITSIGVFILEKIIVKHIGYQILWNWGLFWFPFILITPGLCILIAWGVRWAKNHIPRCHAFIYSLGTLSLEMYLISIGLIEFWKEWTGKIDFGNAILEFAIGFGALFIFTYALSYLLSWIVRKSNIKLLSSDKKAVGQ